MDAMNRHLHPIITAFDEALAPDPLPPVPPEPPVECEGSPTDKHAYVWSEGRKRCRWCGEFEDITTAHVVSPDQCDSLRKRVS